MNSTVNSLCICPTATRSSQRQTVRGLAPLKMRTRRTTQLSRRQVKVQAMQEEESILEKAKKVAAFFEDRPQDPAQNEAGSLVPPAPMGLPAPSVEPTALKPRSVGFYDSVEIRNGRYAMIGFFALLAFEAIFGPILELFGVQTGNGIDLGF
mmetsp:Transcript_20668/g.24838  ORF Transcript_20668/g.24838 Transcript_20668/m.24838 type:complete len:152 (-) Transcript_20668:208-663(-)|eukprot:CAMPEP_0197847964 /NCGR_PEP_ID=MMETSP1438-20131217/7635_1 /TAXON_ID=1461541 /ORGANISM="Pterosperma sp., Strain CCMP1384" /LENGTH=151 /DNA_ID=CAMNT_0043460055 /DNA_START=87 /DNA_END=542 /DNA_ORIENTATION=+